MHIVVFALLLAQQQPPDSSQRLAPIVVTANAVKGPLPATTIEQSHLSRDARPSFALQASDVAGVRAQSTGAMIAKPVIRGLAGARVLTLENGYRLEDYSWSDEDGPSADPRLAQRIDVIRGPASLLYGSDAIGGVVNQIPEAIPVAAPGERVLRWDAELIGSTNNPGVAAGLETQWAKGNYGARMHIVGHFAGSTMTPVCELENTGFSSLNGEVALGVHGRAGSASLRVSRFGGEFKLLEAGGAGASIPAGCPGGPPRPPNETGGPERKVEDVRVQLGGATAWRGLGLEARAQYQNHTTIELSDDFTPGVETETIHLGLSTMTLDLLAHHRIGAGEGTIGVSGMFQENRTQGVAPLVPAATTNGAAIFAIERIPFGRLSLLAGVRADVRGISADSNTGLALGAQTRNSSAVTGDVGMTLDLAPGLVLGANVGRAFRAPNLFELFSNGPRLGEARYEVGDATMKPEVSLNFDASLRWRFGGVRGEIAAFHNRIDNFIFITPTSQFKQTGTPSNLDSLRVYLYGQAQATLWGGEASLMADFTSHVSGYARADFVHGDNTTSNSPLPLMPPARAVIGGEFHATAEQGEHPWYVGAELEGVARQDRLAQFDIATDEYLLVAVTGGFNLTVLRKELQFDLRVRNLTNASYRNYMNRYKEFALDAGRSLELRIGTEF